MRTHLIQMAVVSGILATPLVSSAQTPSSISFQGYLTDAGGAPLDGNYSITIGLYTTNASPTSVWSRNYPSWPISNGIVNLSLSGGTPNISTISFDRIYYLELTIGGETISPRTPLNASPYTRGLRLPIDAADGVGGLGAAAFKITNETLAGENYAIFGESHAPGGNGVRGWATATSGDAWGVYGESASSSGRGVFGRATSASGVTAGIYGLSTSTTGRGVLGWATATSGNAYGVYGESASTTGRAIYGLATNATGVNYGLYGETVSSSGIGVNGVGGTYGVRGSTNYAFATAGVSGSTESLSGYGGHFTGGSGIYAQGVNNIFPDLVLAGNGGSDDDGRVFSDRLAAGSDIWIHSNDAVVIILDDNGDGEDSDFEIRDKDDLNIFNVDEDGTVTADGVIVHSSDRNRKEDIVPVDPAAILEEITRLPVHSWRYKDQPEMHIGPMAQDFYAAFALGADDTHIAGSDANGVALAAIQALYEIVMRQQEEIERMRNEDRKMKNED